MPDDVKAAIVAAGQEFNPLSQRAADEMSELLDALPAGHGSESRDVNSDAASILSALTASGHDSSRRGVASDAASIMSALTSAGHGSSR
jgi:hypothetical protein